MLTDVGTMCGAAEKVNYIFSWPVTTPFYIMHVNLWIPGKLMDKKGRILNVINCMCDLTQFIISVIVNEANS